MSRRVIGFTSEVLLFVQICSAPLLAQLPNRLKRCLPYPTLADEIAEMKESTSRPQPKVKKFIVDQLKFDGAVHFPRELLSRLAAEIIHQEFEGSGWLNQLVEVSI